MRPSQGGSCESAAGSCAHVPVRKTTGEAAASATVPAVAFCPSSATNDLSDSGPRLLLTITSCPEQVRCLAIARPIFPAPMIPIFIDYSSFALRDRDDTQQHQDSGRRKAWSGDVAAHEVHKAPNLGRHVAHVGIHGVDPLLGQSVRWQELPGADGPPCSAG